MYWKLLQVCASWAIKTTYNRIFKKKNSYIVAKSSSYAVLETACQSQQKKTRLTVANREKIVRMDW